MEIQKNVVEKFPTSDLSELRTELMQSGLDSWQVAELISAFLAGRGYGVCNEEARSTAARLDTAKCTLAGMQEELERLAYVM